MLFGFLLFSYFRLRRAIVSGPEVVAGCGRNHQKENEEKKMGGDEEGFSQVHR